MPQSFCRMICPINTIRPQFFCSPHYYVLTLLDLWQNGAARSQLVYTTYYIHSTWSDGRRNSEDDSFYTILLCWVSSSSKGRYSEQQYYSTQQLFHHQPRLCMLRRRKRPYYYTDDDGLLRRFHPQSNSGRDTRHTAPRAEVDSQSYFLHSY